MLIKAKESDRKLILDYCQSEPSINLFIIGDIERYGFDSPIQDVWFQYDDDLSGVVLRYHDNLIVYTKTHLDYEAILPLIDQYSIRVVSGKASVVEDLYPMLSDTFKRNAMHFAELTQGTKLVRDDRVQTARVSDAYDIALKYGDFEEFNHLYSHLVEEREKQIANRISSLEGTHMFIRNGSITAHGNTAAETSSGAMIGGVFTDKAHRRQGLAKAVVSELSWSLLEEGKRACLFYSSPAAEKLFKSLGFKDIDQWVIMARK